MLIGIEIIGIKKGEFFFILSENKQETDKLIRIKKEIEIEQIITKFKNEFKKNFCFDNKITKGNKKK